MRNRSWLAIGMAVAVGTSALAFQESDATRRYAIPANLRLYPQSTPKEALASVLTAIDNKRIDYLLAQLTDPAFVDRRVKNLYGGDFAELVRETTAKLANEPGTAKELGRFLKEGEWEVNDTSASARLKDVKDRQVFLRKVDDRWYLENRQKPAAAKSEG